MTAAEAAGRAGSMDKRVDLAIALGVTAAGLWLVYHSGQMAQGSVVDPLGEDGMIRGLGWFLATAGAALSLRRLWQWRRHGRQVVPSEGVEDEPGIPAHAARAFALWAVVVGYAVLLPRAGYLLATPPFLLAAMALLGMRRWLRAVLVAVLFTFTVYAVFEWGLQVRLPATRLW